MTNIEELLAESRTLMDRFQMERTREHTYWSYEPLWYQKQWFESDKVLKLILAGNRVGKTYTLVEKALIEATGQPPPAMGGHIEEFRRGHLKGKRLLLCGETFGSMKQTILPHLEQLIDDKMIVGKPKIGTEGMWREVTFQSGAILVFQSYEQRTDRQEGGRWDWVGLDEPPPEDVFTTLFRGCIDEGGEIWVSATPLKGIWMKDALIEPSQDMNSELYQVCDYFRVDMHDNCRECNGGYLPHDRIVSFLATLSEEERAARGNGMFLEQTGLSYGYVSRSTHVVPDYNVPWEHPIVEIIDPSSTRGIWIGHFAVDPNDYWTQIHADRIADGAMGYMCDQIKFHRERHLTSAPVLAICDSRFGGQIANKDEQKTWLKSFEDNGLKYEPSVTGIHERLHDWLRVPLRHDGEPMRPKLVMTESVSRVKQGPLWSTERFRWSPDQSYRERYKQAGKDHIDLWLYLANHPGLTFERLSAKRGAREEARKPLNLTYARSRRVGEHPIQTQMRMVLGTKTRNKLRRQGWNMPGRMKRARHAFRR